MIDNTMYQQYLHSDKWKTIAQERMKIDGYKCVCCGTTGDTTNPLEVHHLSYKYLYREETRVYEDLVTLCHVHHKMLHNIMNRVTNKDGRKGWSNNPTIPKIHVFNINGSSLNFMERNEV